MSNALVFTLLAIKELEKELKIASENHDRKLCEDIAVRLATLRATIDVNLVLEALNAA